MAGPVAQQRIYPGCILLEVQFSYGSGRSVQYHKPETLEQNFEAEDEARRRARREALEDWVNTNGVEVCHTVVDQIWNNP